MIRTWWAVLETARRLPDAGFSAFDVAAALKMDPGDASAWCAKLANWGYLRRLGRSGRGRERAAMAYRLTRYGRTRPPPTGPRRYSP